MLAQLNITRQFAPQSEPAVDAADEQDFQNVLAIARTERGKANE
jgi:hypothetical protein